MVTFESLDVESSAYLEGIRVKFVYEGHRLQVKVTVQIQYFRNAKLRSTITSGSMKHRAMKLACSLGLLAMADRMVWPPSLSRDQKWPRVWSRLDRRQSCYRNVRGHSMATNCIFRYRGCWPQLRGNDRQVSFFMGPPCSLSHQSVSVMCSAWQEPASEYVRAEVKNTSFRTATGWWNIFRCRRDVCAILVLFMRRAVRVELFLEYSSIWLIIEVANNYRVVQNTATTWFLIQVCSTTAVSSESK